MASGEGERSTLAVVRGQRGVARSAAGAGSEQRIALAQAIEDGKARCAGRLIVAPKLREQRFETCAAGFFRIAAQSFEEEGSQRVDFDETQFVIPTAGQEDQRRIRRRLGRPEFRRDAMHRKAIRKHASQRRDNGNAIDDIAERIVRTAAISVSSMSAQSSLHS